MRDLNEHTITAEVISPSPAVKPARQASQRGAGTPSACLCARNRTQPGRMGIRHRLPHAHGSNVRRQAARVHFAVRCAGRLDAGRCHQPPHARRRYRNHRVRPLLCRRRQRVSLGQRSDRRCLGYTHVFTGSVSSIDGSPISNATVDLWQSDGEGFYDVQRLDTLALRGRLHSDANGKFNCWTLRPSCYPIPDDGPVGQMLEAQGRHPYRPAHVHFMIQAPGYEKLVTHVFADGDQYLDSDVVFGVKNSLIRTYEMHDPGTAPDGSVVDQPYARLHYDFILKSTND